MKKKPSGKQYVYYHCTGKGKIKTCKKDSYISEGKIDKFLAEILKGLSDIPQYVIDVIKHELKVVHDLKADYSCQTQNNIEKRIKEIDRMIQNGYQRMLKNNNEYENELWNETYKSLRAEKEELRNKQVQIDKADDGFYKQSDLILKFCKNAHALFLKATPEEKRTICEIIGSNFIANGKNIDIDLYPVFYDIIAMKQLGTQNIAGFELPESSSIQQKRASGKALNLNGGNDEAVLDLLHARIVSFLKPAVLVNSIFSLSGLVGLCPSSSVRKSVQTLSDSVASEFFTSYTPNHKNKRIDPIGSILLLNGGADAHRFELLQKYEEHLNAPCIAKICYLINTLKLIA